VGPFAGPDQGVVIVEGRVAGEPVRVLIDSGAQSSVIDRGLAEKLKLPLTAFGPVVVAFGVSGSPQLGRSAILDIDFGPTRFEGLRAAVLELAPISAASQRAFGLIIGQDALRTVVADLDFPGRRIAFHDPDAYTLPPGARPIPARTEGRELLVPVTVESRPMELVFDTGASGALALSRQVAEEHGLLAGRPLEWADSVTFGGVSRDRVIRVATMTFAGEVYPNVLVHIYEPSQGARLPKGLLGAEAFDRFRVIVDLKRGRLHLAPTSPAFRRRRSLESSRNVPETSIS
jgi:predicted aspartyl protease